MEKYYHFAGVDLVVSVPDDRMYEDDRALADFRVEISGVSENQGNLEKTVYAQQPHHFHFTVMDTLEPPVGEELAVFPSYRVYAHGEGRNLADAVNGKDNDNGNDTDNVMVIGIGAGNVIGNSNSMVMDTDIGMGTVRYIGSVQESWENAYIHVKNCGKRHDVQLKASHFPDRIGVKTVLTSLGAEHLVVEAGGFIFHSSYIEWDGKAILFTAPSETGKSTQADLWHDLRGAGIINGDRSVIRVVNGEIVAAGLPFAGSSQYCSNRTLPLAAIVYLQQAPVTSIYRLKGARAFRCIWEGISVNTWNKADVEQVSELVQQVIGQVPVYQLACTPDESAVNALEQMLEKQMEK